MHEPGGAAAQRVPRVVACLPAWNSGAVVGPVLASLAAQTYANLDVLISVDACDDGTGALCDAFASTYPRARVIHQPTRLGWLGNSNALLEAAEGDYAFFAFHDDPLDPDYVARLVDALDREPGAVLAFCDIASNIGLFSYLELNGVDDRFERARRLLVQRGQWWVPGHGLIRISALARLGAMRRHRAGEASADLPWLLRLAMLGTFVRVPAALVTKSFHGKSLSAGWRNDTFTRIAVTLACLEVIRASGFSRSQTLRMHVEGAIFAVRLEWWYLKQWLIHVRKSLLRIAP